MQANWDEKYLTQLRPLTEVRCLTSYKQPLNKVFVTLLLMFSPFIVVFPSSRVCLASIFKLHLVSKS